LQPGDWNTVVSGLYKNPPGNNIDFSSGIKLVNGKVVIIGKAAHAYIIDPLHAMDGTAYDLSSTIMLPPPKFTEVRAGMSGGTTAWIGGAVWKFGADATHLYATIVHVWPDSKWYSYKNPDASVNLVVNDNHYGHFIPSGIHQYVSSICIDETSPEFGKVVWETVLDAPRSGTNAYATAQVFGDLVYAVDSVSNLYIINKITGERLNKIPLGIAGMECQCISGVSVVDGVIHIRGGSSSGSFEQRSYITVDKNQESVYMMLTLNGK